MVRGCSREGDEYADADDDVGHGEDLSGVGGWRDVAIADGGERDHAEVQAVDPAKVFDEAIEDRASSDDGPGHAQDGAAGGD